MNRSGSNDLVIQNNTWSGASNNVDYNESFTYDANGNILTLTRYGTSAQQQSMDELTYNYYSGTNRLEYVEDIVDPDNYTTDIDDQNTGNYTYDEIGNLKSDVQEEIANIDWTVYGKIKSVTRTASSTKDDLEFKYDASGNRIAKIVKPHGSAPSAWTTTYYTRDASGNIMATYQDKQNDADLYLQEQNLFGSSRLGVFNRDLNLTSPLATTPNIFTHTLGKKSYELSNHLGNVLAVVSDRKIPHNNGGTIDYYNASLISANDYYTFGMLMPGRNYSANSYRFGYNKGSEKDDEIAGSGNHFTTFYREGDTRLLTWWSPDPEADEQPWQSPYSYMDGNPIQFNDPDGDCPWCLTALVGGLIEGGVELGGQLLSGKSLSEVDWADVGVEFTKGAVTGSGAGLLARGVVSQVGDVVKAGVDVSYDKGVESVTNGKKSIGAATIDYAVGKAFDAGASKLAKTTDKAVEKTAKVSTQANKVAVKAEAKATKVVNKTGGYGVKATAAVQKAKDAGVNAANANVNRAAAKTANMAVKSKGAAVIKNAASNKVADKLKEVTGATKTN